MKFKAYPLTVKPILKEKVWGGRNLKPFVDIGVKKTGEAWMLSDQGKDRSVILDGVLRGMTLGKAIEKYPAQMMGPALIKKYGRRFPLLFKYLDTNDRLSVQVHPDDVYAGKKGLPAGKTEMWYVMANKPGSSLFVGFKGRQTKKSLAEAAGSGKLASMLKKYGSAKGDSFFIPAGTVHAIGKGNVIYEVQQNSDVTYRLYDWGRRSSGDDRPLHISDAINSVKFYENNPKAAAKPGKFADSITLRQLAQCAYFNAAEAVFEKNASYWYNENRALVMAVIDGEIDITTTEGENHRYVKGGHVFIPYGLTGLLIKALKSSRLIITEAK